MKQANKSTTMALGAFVISLIVAIASIRPISASGVFEINFSSLIDTFGRDLRDDCCSWQNQSNTGLHHQSPSYIERESFLSQMNSISASNQNPNTQPQPQQQQQQDQCDPKKCQLIVRICIKNYQSQDIEASQCTFGELTAHVSPSGLSGFEQQQQQQQQQQQLLQLQQLSSFNLNANNHINRMRMSRFNQQIKSADQQHQQMMMMVPSSSNHNHNQNHNHFHHKHHHSFSNQGRALQLINFHQSIRFPFNFTWPGSFSLLVDAWYESPTGLQQIAVPFSSQQMANIEQPRPPMTLFDLYQRQLIIRHSIRGWLPVKEEWTNEVHKTDIATLAYSYRVTCQENYFGDQCNILCRPRDDIYGHYTCSQQGSVQCLQGWQGTYCSEPICLAGCQRDQGNCSRPNECQCRFGWQGPTCAQCVKHPSCVHGYCNKPHECICHEGWTGPLCNEDANFCSSNKQLCQNGASCINSIEANGRHSYTCNCLPGFSGKNCERSSSSKASSAYITQQSYQQVSTSAANQQQQVQSNIQSQVNSSSSLLSNVAASATATATATSSSILPPTASSSSSSNNINNTNQPAQVATMLRSASYKSQIQHANAPFMANVQPLQQATLDRWLPEAYMVIIVSLIILIALLLVRLLLVDRAAAASSSSIIDHQHQQHSNGRRGKRRAGNLVGRYAASWWAEAANAINLNNDAGAACQQSSDDLLTINHSNSRSNMSRRNNRHHQMMSNNLHVEDVAILQNHQNIYKSRASLSTEKLTSSAYGTLHHSDDINIVDNDHDDDQPSFDESIDDSHHHNQANNHSGTSTLISSTRSRTNDNMTYALYNHQLQRVYQPHQQQHQQHHQRHLNHHHHNNYVSSTNSSRLIHHHSYHNLSLNQNRSSNVHSNIVDAPPPPYAQVAALNNVAVGRMAAQSTSQLYGANCSTYGTRSLYGFVQNQNQLTSSRNSSTNNNHATSSLDLNDRRALSQAPIYSNGPIMVDASAAAGLLLNPSSLYAAATYAAAAAAASGQPVPQVVQTSSVAAAAAASESSSSGSASASADSNINNNNNDNSSPDAQNGSGAVGATSTGQQQQQQQQSPYYVIAYHIPS